MKMSEHPLYSTWSDIRTRCYNPKHQNFEYYGARGIKMCDTWRYNFWQFVEDMPQKPSPKMCIDRINNEGDYSPENCRWVTYTKNNRNRRSTKIITFRGESLSSTEWAERLGLHRCGINSRLRKGWTIEKALTTPKDFNKDQTYKHKKSL